jgi:hypothetical protein
VAQAAMYPSNIQVLHKKTCLKVDISEGVDVTTWTISVRALAHRPDQLPNDMKWYFWDKSPLYSGKGISAIVRVAAGLLASLPHFPTEPQQFGIRTGPGVGRVGGKVCKAYDGEE